MDENNTVTAVQESVVETPTTDVEMGENTEMGAVAEQVDPPKADGEIAAPAQTPEQNREFKQRRLKLESELEELKNERDNAAQTISSYRDFMRTLGYDAENMSDDDVILQATAVMNNTSVDDVRQKREAEERRLRELMERDPELRKLKAEHDEFQQKLNEQAFAQDLAVIKTAYPDEKAKSVFDLGDSFMQLCANGVSPLTAYEALRSEKKRTTKTPPSIGDVKTTEAAKSEYFTREEVKAMSQAEVRKNYGKIRKSMDKWKE